MSTPVINAIDNVNQTSLNNLFTSIAQNQTARDNLSRSDRNIDKVSTNVGVIEALNNNEDAILRILCRREGKNPSNFPTLDSVAADQNLMQSISARQTSSKILARSKKASTAAAGSQTAMQELSTSQTSMQELAVSQTAMDEIDKNDFAVRAIMCGTTTQDPTTFANADAISQDAAAMQEIAGNQTTMSTVTASQAAMQEVAASQTAIDTVIASQTALDTVVASQTAMQEVAASQTAIDTVIASQTALDTVVASQTAMQEVAASQTAMSTIAASQTAMSTVAASQTAMAEVANSQTAINEIGSNTNETITTNTVLNSSTATTEFQNSSLEGSFDFGFDRANRVGGTNLTNARVLVTSNNNSGSEGTGITFTNDVGPETQADTTFIINQANANDGNTNDAGSVGFNGIQIN